MRIYTVRADIDLAWINCKDPDITGMLDHVVHDGVAIDRHKPIILEVSRDDAPGDWVSADCLHFAAYGPLLLSERATSVLGPLLLDAGYLLNASLESEIRYKLFICEKEIDALDQERSDLLRFESGAIWRVSRYELKGDLITGQNVFRLRHRRSQIFVSDEFRRLTQDRGLTGFLFQEIWTTEAGGLQLAPPQVPVERVKGEFARRAAAKRRAFRAELSQKAKYER